jgi:hypothetical protein
LSETITVEAFDTGTDHQAYEPDPIANENCDEQWGNALIALVSANANVIVRCQWMGGAEVTLGEAMTTYNYPPNLTAEDEPSLIAVVNDLLANRVEENSETTEEEEAEQEESDIKAEEEKRPEEKEPAKPKKTEVKIETKPRNQEEQINSNIEESYKHPENSMNNGEKSSESHTGNIIAAKPEVFSGVSNNLESAAEASIVTSGAYGRPAERANVEAGNNPPATAASDDRPKGAMPALEFGQETRQQVPVFEITEASAEVKFIDAEPILSIKEIDLELTAVPGNSFSQEDEKDEPGEVALALSSIDLQTGSDSLATFAETDFPREYLEEIDPQPEELYDTSDVATLQMLEESVKLAEGLNIERGYDEKLSGRIVTHNSERLVPVSITIEEIEGPLIQLAEHIESSPPGIAEAVNEILDKIIELPAKIETQNEEYNINEIEAQKELEELFTELFGMMGIDCPAELIETLARLTLEYHLADEIVKLKIKEETDKIPQVSGTHEIIKKLLAGLSIIKRVIFNAGVIGKSVLQLSRISPAYT